MENSQFVPEIYNLVRAQADVNGPSFTDQAPFMRWDAASQTFLGAPNPAPNFGAGAAGRIVAAGADGTTSAQNGLRFSPVGFGRLTVGADMPALLPAGTLNVKNQVGGANLVIENQFDNDQFDIVSHDGTYPRWSITKSGIATLSGLNILYGIQCGSYGPSQYDDRIRFRMPTGYGSMTLGAGVAGRNAFGFCSTDYLAQPDAYLWREGAQFLKTDSAFEVVGFRSFKNAGTGVTRFFQNVPNTAPTDGALSIGEMSAWVDEGAAKLKFRVRLSDGSYKTAEVILQ